MLETHHSERGPRQPSLSTERVSEPGARQVLATLREEPISPDLRWPPRRLRSPPSKQSHAHAQAQTVRRKLASEFHIASDDARVSLPRVLDEDEDTHETTKNTNTLSVEAPTSDLRSFARRDASMAVPVAVKGAAALCAARHVLRGGGGRHVVRAANALVRDGKEAMSTADAGTLTWYSCGPTVYDDAHLGHARTYVCFDVARRVLGSLARVRVDLTLGVTDVDDKILARATERGESPRTLARRYEARFFADMNALNILPPTRIARVTEHIPVLVSSIADLLAADRAYRASDGTVYYDVAACSNYGILEPGSAASSAEAAAAAVSDDEEMKDERKRDPRDFALWKPTQGTIDEIECRWDSPWGVGRPGWHIECTAMAQAIYRSHVDVHSGGIDLRFPHHTNELAIADGLRFRCGCPPPEDDGKDGSEAPRWVHTWLHAGHLRLSGRKMSKSLKNFISVREYLNTGSADAFRMFCLLHRYGSPVEYGPDRLRDAEGVLRRFRTFVNDSRSAARQALEADDGTAPYDLAPRCARAREIAAAAARARDAVEQALVDDFDTPRAMASLAALITRANRALHDAVASPTGNGAAALASAEAAEVIAETMSICGVTGFHVLGTAGIGGSGNTSSTTNTPKDSGGMQKLDFEATNALDEVVRLRAEVREAANSKDWGRVFAACDRTRARLRERFGVEVRDIRGGASAWEQIRIPTTPVLEED